MAEQEKWQWQEPGRAWKGVGLYHITLTIPNRQPLLGTLDIPGGDPTMTAVRRTRAPQLPSNVILLSSEVYGDNQIKRYIKSSQ